MSRTVADPAQVGLFEEPAPPRETPPIVAPERAPFLAGRLPRRTPPDRPEARRTFAVGRAGRRTREVLFVGARRAPLPGPWSLRALVVSDSTRS